MDDKSRPILKIRSDQDNLNSDIRDSSEISQCTNQTHEFILEQLSQLQSDYEQLETELSRLSKLAELGQLAFIVSHELRNHLVPISLYLSLLHGRVSQDESSLNILGKIETSFTALDATMNDLLHFAKEKEPQRNYVSLLSIVESNFTALKKQIDQQKISVELDIASDHEVYVDRDMFRRVLLNLTLNAIDAMPSGGELVVTSFITNDYIEIELADSGDGISAGTMKHIFDPAFSTKTNGTGLGLAIVQQIATIHGGSVHAMNCPEGGAAFTIRLPRNTRIQELAA